MKRRALWPALLASLWQAGHAAPPSAATTHSSIALANLDAQIRQQADEPDAMDLWLLRMQFLADYRMLDRVAALTESASVDPHALLRRARARAAAHRFTAALADVDAAHAAGATPRTVGALRAALKIAMGRAADVVTGLESEAAQRPGFGSYAALARACGAVGRLDDADRCYAQALQALHSTSPFPTATMAFARGLMWSEQGGQAERGASHYVQALQAVPEFVAARIHLAEFEMARGEEAAAQAGLQGIVAASGEPQAMALLGELHLRQGQAARGRPRSSAPGCATTPCWLATRPRLPTTRPSSTSGQVLTRSARGYGRRPTSSSARRDGPTCFPFARPWLWGGRGRPGCCVRRWLRAMGSGRLECMPNPGLFSAS